MKTRRSADSPISKLMVRLENSAPLDVLVGAADPLMGVLTRNQTVADALQGRQVGHAIHPMLVQLPMGTWTSALLLDIAGHRSTQTRESAQLLTGVGLAFAIPAALTGWAELAKAGRREQRVGVVHASANALGIALQLLAARARRSGDQAGATRLASASMAVMGIGGYLGGHLAVSRSVGTRDRIFDE